MHKILITGFEPFGRSGINPSAEIIRSLQERPIANVEQHTAILPVAREAGPAKLLAKVAALTPDAIFCIGEAGSRSYISIERVGLNLLNYRIPDNEGNQAIDELISPEGPVAYFTTLPAADIVASMTKAGVPTRESLTAGAFLCNQVTYMLMDYLAEQDSVGYAPPAGFIHVPRLPEQITELGINAPSMALETMVEGVRVAVNVTLQLLQPATQAATG